MAQAQAGQDGAARCRQRGLNKKSALYDADN